jgi:hypothetical protein
MIKSRVKRLIIVLDTQTGLSTAFCDISKAAKHLNLDRNAIFYHFKNKNWYVYKKRWYVIKVTDLDLKSNRGPKPKIKTDDNDNA